MAESKSSVCPYVVKELSPEEDDLIKKYYSKYQNKFVRVGETGCLLPLLYQDKASAIKNMQLRPTDIFVVAFPRSGTTWTQELVWLLTYDLDFHKARSVPLGKRTPFLEHSSFENSSVLQYIADTNKHDPGVDELLKLTGISVPKVLAGIPSPRNVRTHLPISLLPEGTLDTAKMIYVARDPRDVIVSCYYFYKSNVLLGLECDFKEFFDMFITDLAPWAPYFDHVKEAWAKRHHPNMLFLFYEELSKDLNATARRVANFLGKQFSDEQYTELREFLSFKNFQKSEAVKSKFMKYIMKHDNFIRRGKAGGWRDEFDEELKLRAESWMEQHLQDTDLRFPEHI